MERKPTGRDIRAAAHQCCRQAEPFAGLAVLEPLPLGEELDRLSGEEAFARCPAYGL